MNFSKPSTVCVSNPLDNSQTSFILQSTPVFRQQLGIALLSLGPQHKLSKRQVQGLLRDLLPLLDIPVRSPLFYSWAGPTTQQSQGHSFCLVSSRQGRSHCNNIERERNWSGASRSFSVFIPKGMEPSPEVHRILRDWAGANRTFPEDSAYVQISRKQGPQNVL